MTDEEKKYQEEAAKAGVDLPEFKAEEGETPEQKTEREAKAKAKADVDAKAKADADENDKGKGEDDKKTPPPTDKKRSIYDDYKEKKAEARTALERAEKAEKERDEFKALLEKSKEAKTPEEKKEALDDLDEFAKEIDASPETLKKMRDLFLKGVKLPDAFQKDMEELKAWKAERAKDEAANAQEDAKKQFENEFTQTIPALKTLFPKASDVEMQAIKTELDKLSHSKGWNDKDLEYIAFKHKDVLSALVSPKKRGMEGAERKDEGATGDDTDFDPNADYSKLSPAEKEKWEKQYKALTAKGEGLATNSSGKKLII